MRARYTNLLTRRHRPRIADIQGEDHTSPYTGQTVTAIEGVVTQYGYTFSNGNIKGFYIQDPKPDSNPDTSDAILCIPRIQTGLKSEIW